MGTGVPVEGGRYPTRQCKPPVLYPAVDSSNRNYKQGVIYYMTQINRGSKARLSNFENRPRVIGVIMGQKYSLQAGLKKLAKKGSKQ